MPDSNILDAPARPVFARFPAGFGPRFVVTVDTEEEFDWSAPLDRTSHGVETVPALATFQRFCEEFGVVPAYLIDYPVAVAPALPAALGQAAQEGRCEIGLQLHPWVNPPQTEALTTANSFAGNLPAELEREKVRHLHLAVERALGQAPVAYRAGRYGAGPATAAILRDAGIGIDTSARSRFDYSDGGGPDYRFHPLAPYWIDQPGGLLELPLTTVFWGPLRRQGDWLYPRLWRVPRLRGALARLGLLERIPLTPEGVTAAEALRGIDIALDDGLPVLVFSFHSPSLVPGHTPYVRTPAELDAFFAWWRTVFGHLARRGVRPASPSQIRNATALA